MKSMEEFRILKGNKCLWKLFLESTLFFELFYVCLYKRLFYIKNIQNTIETDEKLSLLERENNENPHIGFLSYIIIME